MTDLTEKWKGGELSKGKEYWCKLIDGSIEVCYLWLTTNKFTFSKGHQGKCVPDNDIEEVLLPVPTYQEFEALRMNCEFIHKCLNGCRLKNTELMRLLKECQTQIDDLLYTCIELDEAMCFEQGCKWSEELFRKENKDVYELLTKINEVLK